MKLIVCIDKFNGTMFNKRRQSRDANLIDDLIELIGSSELYISNYSKPLFEKYNSAQIIDDPSSILKKDAYYFLEGNTDDIPLNYIDELVIYKWNRHYPADVHFNIDLSLFKLDSVFDFEGSSHKKITREVYKRK